MEWLCMHKKNLGDDLAYILPGKPTDACNVLYALTNWRQRPLLLAVNRPPDLSDHKAAQCCVPFCITDRPADLTRTTRTSTQVLVSDCDWLLKASSRVPYAAWPLRRVRIQARTRICHTDVLQSSLNHKACTSPLGVLHLRQQSCRRLRPGQIAFRTAVTGPR